MSGADSPSLGLKIGIGALVATCAGVIIAFCALGRDYYGWTAEEDPPVRPDTGAIQSPITTPATSPVEQSPTPDETEAEGGNGRGPDTPSAPSTSTRANVQAKPAHGGPLVINVTLCCQAGKIGPNTWRNGATVSAGIEVFDDTGSLDKGCYAKWTLTRGGETIEKGNSYCRSHGITPWGRQNMTSGEYTLTTDITTDWGVSGKKVSNFTIAS